MSTTYEIPLINQPQTFVITLAGVQYRLTVLWCARNNTWLLNIADIAQNPILNGIPLVTGADLLDQYGYLNFGGQLIAQTDNDITQPPTFDNLGSSGHLYFVVQ